MMFLLLLALVLPLASAGDLNAVKAEPNPERRYALALDNALEAVKAARAFIQEGKSEEFRKSLDEVVESVKLCDDTLRGTGKNPSRQSKHFKRAELRIRDVIRKLDSLNQDAGFEDRPAVAEAKSKIQQRHEELLLDIMGRRK